MQRSVAVTFQVPNAFTQGGPGPTPVARGTEVPIRVVVRNRGPNVLLLAYNAEDVRVGGGQTFQLPPGDETVLVCSPKQALYAGGIGPGGVISASYSEALPTDRDGKRGPPLM